MPRSVPNYLTIDPTTGAVGAFFTGGVQMQEGSLVGGTFDIDKGIGFKRAHTTIAPGVSDFAGTIYENEQGAGNFFDGMSINVIPDPGREGRLTLQAIPDPFGNSDYVYMALRNAWRNAGASGIFVSASPFGGGGTNDHEYTLMDAAYRSSWWQKFPTPSQAPGIMRLGFGSASVPVVGGWGSYGLSFGFTMTQVFGATYSIGAQGASIDLAGEISGFSTSGFVVDIHSTIAQTVSLYWMMWGTGP